jgi:hypothetical protein
MQFSPSLHPAELQVSVIFDSFPSRLPGTVSASIGAASHRLVRQGDFKVLLETRSKVCGVPVDQRNTGNALHFLSSADWHMRRPGRSLGSRIATDFLPVWNLFENSSLR